MRQVSLDSVCISLYEPRTLIFHGAGSVPSQSGPSEAVLVVWAVSILFPLLLLGLALGTHHRCNFKACRMTGLTAMKRIESGEQKREQRDLGAA